MFFFDALRILKENNISFRLAVCGEAFANRPECFEKARHDFQKETVIFGPVSSRSEYVRLLCQANIVVSTAYQEFQGLSVIEAMWCGAFPVLPNRLNYPIILPKLLHQTHLYDSDNELAGRLIHILLSAGDYLPFPSRLPFLELYNWSRVAGELDELVANVARMT